MINLNEIHRVYQKYLGHRSNSLCTILYLQYRKWYVSSVNKHICAENKKCI